MKQLYILFFLIASSFNVHSQNDDNTTAVDKYQKSVDSKEDFWSKVKNIFKPKKERRTVERTSDPVLVKNDPNRTVRRVSRAQNYRQNEYSSEMKDDRNKMGDKEKVTTKKKKTFSQFWNELVNGKGYVPSKDYSGIRKKLNKQSESPLQTPRANSSNEVVIKGNPMYNNYDQNNKAPNKFQKSEKASVGVPANVKINNNIQPRVAKPATVPNTTLKNSVNSVVPVANVKSASGQTKTEIVNAKVAPAIISNVAKPKVTTANTAVVKEVLNVRNTIPKKEVTKNNESNPVDAVINSKVLASNITVPAKKPEAVNTPIKNEATTIKITDPKIKEVASVVKPVITAKPKVVETKPKIETPIEKDNTIRNEIQPLSLTHSTNGTAAYFFSGGAFGKFYVVTNVASKGSVIKVINAQNGRSLLAEVLDNLPNSDSKRGLLLKISDNAKLPLGQSNKSFAVKVNY